ncbi:MAG: DMT family transporter [Candidatus Pacebacteria bacterium]|nr:DMT family transporter [Candidatus Paceibacterota bacterium]
MSWVKWALGEAAFRVTSITLLKVIGTLASTLGQLALSTLIIGGVQVVAAGCMLIYTRTSIWATKRQILGSIAFGIGAFFGTMLPFVAFMLGANLAVYTFLALLAIVPGALIDRIFFGEKLVIRQLSGIALAVFAGWLVMNMPNLNELATLPLWAWLALINACTLAINQGVTRWIKEVDIWIKNFWGGVGTTVLCLLSILILGPEAVASIATGASVPIVAWSAVIAIVVIGLWSFNVLAYRSGASIPTKNVFVNGAYLFGALAIGYLFFGEPVQSAQLFGILTYIVAFILINNTVWNYVTKKTV